jgi:hypothetical protein
MSMIVPRTLWLSCTVVAVLLSACGGQDESKPYFSFAGGGFVFNYRNADLYYGLVLKPERTAPKGSVLEVDFELDDPGRHDIQRVPVREGQVQYGFRTPDLRGVKIGKDYIAVVRLLDGTKEIWRFSKPFRTDVDTSKLPSEPLVVGPGYQTNPALPQPQ